MTENQQSTDRTAIQDQLVAGKRVAAWATVLTIGLALMKGVVGWWRGSPALSADAVHSFADTLAIFASWVGLKLAERPPTKRFPFGLYRAETLATLLVAVIILLAGFHLLIQSIQGLQAPVYELHHSVEVLFAALISTVVSLGIYLWENRVGTRLGSQSLLANADESRVDIMTSLAVLLGSAASYMGISRVEMIVTVVLSVVIIWLGIKHGRIALLSLLDASLDPELERRVISVAKEVPGVMRVVEVQLRRAGLFWFGLARIQLRRSVDMVRGHDIAHDVVRAVRNAVPRIEALTIHTEPFVPEELSVLVPVNTADVTASLSEHFGRAPFFAYATLSGKQVKHVEFIKNPARKEQARAGLAAIKQIFQKNRADAVLTREIGEISFHALRDYYVEVYAAPAAPLEDVLEQFTAGGLPILLRPTHESEAAGK